MTENFSAMQVGDSSSNQEITNIGQKERPEENSIITRELPATRMASIILMTIHGMRKTP